MLAAKTTSDAPKTSPFPPNPNSPQSTINTVEREIREAGGRAATVAVDVRDVAQIQHAVDETVRVFGKLDVLVYNSGAIWWSSVEKTSLKRFRLMQQVNPEGLYATVQAALPHFEKNGWRGRIVVVSPPIYSRFFRGKTAYAMGKCQPSDILIVNHKEESSDRWHRQGRYECLGEGPGHGFCAPEPDRNGCNKRLACLSRFLILIMHKMGKTLLMASPTFRLLSQPQRNTTEPQTHHAGRT